MEPKFNLNRPPINDEEINSNKDFGELVKKFKQQSIRKARQDVSFLKNKKVTYSSIIAGVAVICTVTYFSVFKKNPPKETSNDKITTIQNGSSTSQTKSNKAFIAPPISKLNVPYTSYHVKAEQGANITHKLSKSKIIIPKKAFVNKQGQDIVGDVEIRYREFHNQADIIASGIPMQYDSAGIKTHLESAGMLDIRGYQNNEPVFIKPNKTITVEFASSQPADKYNMYVLDTIGRNWVYTGRDNSLKGLKKQEGEKIAKEPEHNLDSPKMMALQKQIDAIPPKIETEKTVYEKKINQLPKTTQPSIPNKAIAGRPQFQLDVNYKEFPELEAFKNAVFEVGSENKNYDSKIADITWSSANVSEGPQKGKNYLLTLTLRARVEKLIVYPALTGADYDKALKSYEAKFADYKATVAKREATEKKLKEEFEAKQTAYTAELKKYNEDMVKERVRMRQQQEQELADEFSTLSKEQAVTRIFNISNFGICNSDCPSSMPKGESMHPVFITNNGASFITPHNTYLVSHSKNVVYTIYNGSSLSYDPKDTYSICVLASNGKMYLCDKQTFANSVVATKQHKIPVTLLSEEVNDAHDLKMAMGI